ncbi:MAG: substrate-binding domain-containing protein, partial [Polaromonas sp.]|nr:substrate-binding domain-containing protein [Polaromonas sp.]
MTITGISSMATRQLLIELAASYQQQTGIHLKVDSVGGVNASNRILAGEAFDLVFLASDAI